MRVVIAYDTPSAQRRKDLLRHSRGALFHIQRSVFEGDLRAREFARLRRTLAAVADRRSDRVRIYVLCASCSGQAMSLAGPAHAALPRVTVVGARE